MTKSEAVELIDERMCFGRGKWSEHHMPEIDDYWKAGQMAIKALERPARKKGRWEITDACPHNVCCSECHKKFAQTHWAVWEDGSLPRNYCPNCGARMEEINEAD